jgi:hypothetical protein
VSGLGFRFEAGGFLELAAAVLARQAMTSAAVQTALEEGIVKLQDIAQTNSSGRPGPNIVTGSYHDSWFTAVGQGEAVLSNFQPQALRLEFGFVGTDSLDRFYNQPPYAHLGPAVQTFGPEFGDIIVRAFKA